MKKIFVLLLFLLLGFLSFSYAHALELTLKYAPPCIGGFGCADATDLRGYIIRLYQFGLGISGILAVGMITAGGILWSFSGAVDKKKEAQEMIQSALWGVALLFGSYLILKTINPQLVVFRLPGGDDAKPLIPVITRACSDFPIFVPNPSGGSPAPIQAQAGVNCWPKCGVGQSPCKAGEAPKSEGGDSECVRCAYSAYNCPKEIFETCKPIRVDVPFDGSGGVDLSSDVVPDCEWAGIGDCSDAWDGEPGGEHIDEGGTYWQYPYYPKNIDPITNPSEVRCVIYAFKEEHGSSTISRPEIAGLKKC